MRLTSVVQATAAGEERVENVVDGAAQRPLPPSLLPPLCLLLVEEGEVVEDGCEAVELICSELHRAQLLLLPLLCPGKGVESLQQLRCAEAEEWRAATGEGGRAKGEANEAGDDGCAVLHLPHLPRLRTQTTGGDASGRRRRGKGRGSGGGGGGRRRRGGGRPWILQHLQLPQQKEQGRRER